MPKTADEALRELDRLLGDLHQERQHCVAMIGHYLEELARIDTYGDQLLDERLLLLAQQ